jgi:hypothetical protein
MKCYLCEANSDIEKKIDEFLVRCSGACGPYIITQIALSDLSMIHGRKQGAADRVSALRKRDAHRLIRVDHDSVSFAS